MAIHAERNLYPGVNAHLNNLLQTSGRQRWRSFHHGYIEFLRVALDRILPAGYVASAEDSLQIEEYDPDSGHARKRISIADVQIYRTSGLYPTPAPLSEGAAAPTLMLPLVETVDPEDALAGLIIYQSGEGDPPGRPITRIEMLSPSNKPGGSHHQAYFVKRALTLKSGVRVVEIDLLHLSPPVDTTLPNYLNDEPQAAPYAILVSDPRPTYDQGMTAVYGFGVTDPLPQVRVPLAGVDAVTVDFGAIYQDLYASSRLFHALVDYAQEPPAFERFLPADRETIRTLLDAIRREWAR
jgi:hypothetical protein